MYYTWLTKDDLLRNFVIVIRDIELDGERVLKREIDEWV